MKKRLTKKMKQNKFWILRIETNNGSILKIVNLLTEPGRQRLTISRYNYAVNGMLPLYYYNL